jgi:pyruvate,water dikinase
MLDWLRRRRKAGPEAGLEFRARYESFRRLLGRNSELLALLTDLDTDLNYQAPSEPRVRGRITAILDLALDLIQDLNELTDGAGDDLFPVHQNLDQMVRARLAEEHEEPGLRLTVGLEEAAAGDLDLCGGKAGHLAELRRALPEAVPGGFVATTLAYQRLAATAQVGERMRALVAERHGEAALTARAQELRSLVEATPVPAEVAAEIEARAAAFPGTRRWAVRSSGVGEDGRLSFAGQFDTLLGVPPEELVAAYRSVAASRFSDRALAYRLDGGLAEIATPMAVLFLPMVEARAAGVIYTTDPHDPEARTMWVSSAFGLGSEVVGGKARADLFIVARDPLGEVVERRVAEKTTRVELRPDGAGTILAPVPEAERLAPSLDDATLARLAALGLQAERHFGAPQDVEWAVAADGTPWLLQSRTLVLGARPFRRKRMTDLPVKLRARPLAPGRGVGNVFHAPGAAELEAAPEGAVLVVRQATPELARALHRIAALVAESGSPQSHAAALVRQAGVPAVYDAAGAFEQLAAGEAVGVDGTRGEVYPGIPWPELRGRHRDRAARPRAAGFFYDRLLRLTLVDPAASSFRPEGCTSIHDLVRLVHERALAAMFRLGDRYARGRKRAARRLASAIPLDLEILDLGGGLAPEATQSREVAPEQITSIPFAALWRGVADPRVAWAGRQHVSAAGFASVMATAMLDDAAAMRRLGDRNYVVVASDYLNLNARLAYHYTMLDAVVGDLPDNNYVAFRFRGGGAGSERRDLRARFLAGVLGHVGFGVDRRADLLNAWLRAAPRATCEDGLALLGRLMACARQLDMLMSDPESVTLYTERFLREEYEEFR